MAEQPVQPVETADDVDAIVALIASEQARPERLITYVGVEPVGIRAELDGLEPPWAETARVVRDEEGAIVAAVVVEWDEALRRAWIVGPWVAGDADAWAAHADRLVDAALAQVSVGVTQFELSGDVANALLADLAADLGWSPTEVNHALVADAATIEAWPPADAETDPFRPAIDADVVDIAGLHDAEFPGTYASAAQLLAGQTDGSRLVLVAPGPGPTGIAGYAAGQVHDDGEGFIDFVVVDPASRGSGLGRRLITELTRQLLARSTNGRVCLTVQDHRVAARALYEGLGFRPDGSFVAYRSWTHG